MVDEGKTHYEGCWQERGHHDCARARIRALTEAVELLIAGIQDATAILTSPDLTTSLPNGTVISPNVTSFGLDRGEEFEDPVPWCHTCGARSSFTCTCGPTASNH